MSWVSLIGEAVSRHDDWGAALDHVATQHGTSVEALWFKDAPGCAWIFEGQPSDMVAECIARVFDPVQYQRAKSRGDLEPPAQFQAGPEVTLRPGEPTDQQAMTKTPTQPKAKKSPNEPLASSEDELQIVSMSSAEMERIPIECSKLVNGGERKPPALRGFEHGGKTYVAVSAAGNGTGRGWEHICACAVLRPAQILESSVPKVRDHTAGRMFYYGQHVTVKGKPFRVGAKELKIVPAVASPEDACAKNGHKPGTLAQPKKDSRGDASFLSFDVLKPVDWDRKGYFPGEVIHTRFYKPGKLLTALLTEGKIATRSSAPAVQSSGQFICLVCGWIGDATAENSSMEPGQDLSVECPKCHVLAEPTTETVSPKSQPKAPDRFEMVHRNRIDPSPWNPRKDFTSAPALEYLAGLAQSIREQGIIEPLIVRASSPLSPDGPHTSETVRYELVAGECRWRSAKIAELEIVPCIVRDLDDLAAIRVQAVENLQRRDINPLEEAEGYNLLMRRGQYNVSDICRETGKSEASIYARLKLLDAPPGIRKALQEGRIPASTAELVARIEDVVFRNQAMDAVLFPEHGEADEGADVLTFRQAKTWIDNRKETMAREIEWGKRARESHVFDSAFQVLSATQSDKVLLTGGYVRDSQAWVKPTDPCPADPEGRTYETLAKEGKIALPAPTVAREPVQGAPVVLLPRQEADRAVGSLVPSIEEQERRRRQESEKRKATEEQAAKVREAAAFEKVKRAEGVVLRCAVAPWNQERELEFLRLLVGGIFETFIDDDPDDLEKALKANGLPDLLPGEVNADWCCEYLDGCDADRLRGWLLFFHLRSTGGYIDSLTKASSIDEARLTAAEGVFPASKPQTSAVKAQEMAQI